MASHVLVPAGCLAPAAEGWFSLSTPLYKGFEHHQHADPQNNKQTHRETLLPPSPFPLLLPDAGGGNSVRLSVRKEMEMCCSSCCWQSKPAMPAGSWGQRRSSSGLCMGLQEPPVPRAAWHWHQGLLTTRQYGVRKA